MSKRGVLSDWAGWCPMWGLLPPHPVGRGGGCRLLARAQGCENGVSSRRRAVCEPLPHAVRHGEQADPDNAKGPDARRMICRGEPEFCEGPCCPELADCKSGLRSRLRTASPVWLRSGAVRLRPCRPVKASAAFQAFLEPFLRSHHARMRCGAARVRPRRPVEALCRLSVFR